MSGIVGNNTDRESGLIKAAVGEVEKLASDPGAPVEGQVWFNTTGNVFKYFDGSNTQTVSTE